MPSIPKFSAYGTLFREYATVADGQLAPKLARSMHRAVEGAVKQAGELERIARRGLSSAPDAVAGQRLVDELRRAGDVGRTLVDDLPAYKVKGGVDGRPFVARLAELSDAFAAADDIVRSGRAATVPSLPTASLDDAVRGARTVDVESQIAKLGLSDDSTRLLDVRPRLAEALGSVFRSRTMQRLMRVQVEGAEHVPREGGFVLAATHTGASDLITTSMGHSRVPRIMAHHTLMRNPISRALLEQGGGFPVEPGNARSAISMTEAHLLRGNAVKIYPEGMMPRVDALGPAREGAAIAAIRSGKPVIVQGEYGTRPASQYGESVWRHWTHRGGRGAVVYSEPIPTAHLDPRNRDHVTALAAQIGDEQVRLRERARALVGH